MQQLHAYWRMEYLQAPGYPPGMERPFTALPALGDDRTALIVHRAPLSYLILNRYPYNPGHLLVVPFRDVSELDALTPAERAGLVSKLPPLPRPHPANFLALKNTPPPLLPAALKPDGFNVGFNFGSASGGSIRHLHAHIVPRWDGDNNFMPVLGSTRILPQALDATWERLTEESRKMLVA